MDGFQISKKFYCKELGMLRVGEDEAFSFFFDIGLPWHSLTKQDKRTCRYVQKRIHHLPFGVPKRVKACPITSLGTIVTDFYRCVQKSAISTIAYKGGHYEKDLLEDLDIPAVNLESFGCPKAEHLFDALAWLETCGHHTEPNAYQHCAKVEVEAFGHWLANQKV